MAQENLFTEKSENLDKGPVICLGKTFHSEEERREYFRNELRIKLPELKEIEGFPIGEDEDIINLSDPPYYTACPNPWLNDFIAEWEKEKENIKGRKKDFHVDEPYASDVSEGKNNPIYNAHSYHTKVPHPAIMRYILYYTEPGDIILDGFAGTGMTGVAASFCSNPDSQLKFTIDKEFEKQLMKQPKWGLRKAICNDLSPIATFISTNYNTNFKADNFFDRASALLDRIRNEYGDLYKTIHSTNKVGEINYIVWSEVFVCPNCSNDIVFWDVAVKENEVLDDFKCQNCKVDLQKSSLSKKIITEYNPITLNVSQSLKFVPVIINYKFQNKNYEKIPDEFDINTIKKLDDLQFENKDILIKEFIKGDKTKEFENKKINSMYDLYYKRTLFIISKIFSELTNKEDKFLFTAAIVNLAKTSRYKFKRSGNVPMSGTIYVSSLQAESNVFRVFESKLKSISIVLNSVANSGNTSQCSSASDLKTILDNTIDYIFTDPPFGANLMYSELNNVWENWLKVRTNIKEEAIENRTQNKTTLDYQLIMTECFIEFFRVLKPNKWMTVEFSNTSAAVWNGIQTALQRAGFVIANIAALDKQQGSYNAVMNATSVKQDLVISCYKPSFAFENKIKTLSGEIAVWDFVTEHLHHLPTHLKKDNNTTAIVERSPKILFDRLITFYLMRGLPVPIDARDFQEGLKQRFIERDGMYFTAEQAAEYDEKKAKTPIFVQLSLIVTNESDAIEWLKERLRKEAQKYQDIMPDFRIATQSLRKGDTLPELQDILNESFIQETDGKWRTPDPNEAKDREALRTKVLLKEFTGYVTAINQPKAKKLKEVRVEALRAGFKNSWEQKDFKTIVSLGDKIPQNILLEDEQLLMYYDIAKDRV